MKLTNKTNIMECLKLENHQGITVGYLNYTSRLTPHVLGEIVAAVNNRVSVYNAIDIALTNLENQLSRSNHATDAAALDALQIAKRLLDERE